MKAIHHHFLLPGMLIGFRFIHVDAQSRRGWGHGVPFNDGYWSLHHIVAPGDVTPHLFLNQIVGDGESQLRASGR